VLPAATDPDSVVIDPKLPVPVALAYCSERSSRPTGSAERLKSST